MTSHTDLVAQGAAAADSPVLYRLDEDGVAHVCLNRPAAANGMTLELLQAFQSVLMDIHGDGQVRVVLLTGAGKHFCAGGDVHTFLAKGEQLPGYIRVVTSTLQAVATLLMRMNPPVVTAVQGYAAGGGGMGLVCASDVVVAADTACFLAGATRVGMVPDAGVSVSLTQLVGLRKATEILLFNPVISAADALAMGLVTRVVAEADLGAQALAMARTLAASAPRALAQTKRLLWSGVGLGVDAAMPDENQTQAMLSGTADAREGLLAVVEKRSPVFKGA